MKKTFPRDTASDDTTPGPDSGGHDQQSLRVRVIVGKNAKVDATPPDAAHLALTPLDGIADTVGSGPLPQDEAIALTDRLAALACTVLSLLARVEADALGVTRSPITNRPA